MAGQQGWLGWCRQDLEQQGKRPLEQELGRQGQKKHLGLEQELELEPQKKELELELEQQEQKKRLDLEQELEQELGQSEERPPQKQDRWWCTR